MIKRVEIFFVNKRFDSLTFEVGEKGVEFIKIDSLGVEVQGQLDSILFPLYQIHAINKRNTNCINRTKNF